MVNLAEVAILSGHVRLFEPLIRRQAPTQTGEVHRRFKEILEGPT